MTKSLHTTESGFALLFTIVIVSIVLAIGLAILDFTIKQIVLSSVTRDSEIAFHMSNAGFECMKYLRESDLGGYSSLTSNQNCVGTSDAGTPALGLPANVYGYTFDFDAPNTRCTSVKVIVADASASVVTDVSVRNAAGPSRMDVPIPANGDYTCPEGTICNYVFSIGSNRSCGASGVGVIQREIFGRF